MCTCIRQLLKQHLITGTEEIQKYLIQFDQTTATIEIGNREAKIKIR